MSVCILLFKRSSSSSLWTLILCSAFSLWTPAGGYSQVIGSSQPIVATQGDDVVLLCHVEPPVKDEELTVEWWRPDLPPDPGDPHSQYRYVHRYHQNHDDEDMKMLMYAGRTELFKDGLKSCNVSLKIRKVELSDDGRYRCFLPELQSLQRAADIRLVVEANDVKTVVPTTTLRPRPLQTPAVNTKTKVGGRGGLIAAVAFFILLILGGGGGCLLTRKCPKQSDSCSLTPV